MNEIKRQVRSRKQADNLRSLDIGDCPIDSLDYLARLWTVTSGQRVLDDMYEVDHVVEVDEDYPEQVYLGSGKIGYLQDLFWYPTNKEIDGLLTSFGAKINSDSILFKKAFFALPSNLADYCQLIGQIRFREINLGGQDLLV
jgi:hypothetical protein